MNAKSFQLDGEIPFPRGGWRSLWDWLFGAG
jgi:hypothetical protein